MAATLECDGWQIAATFVALLNVVHRPIRIQFHMISKRTIFSTTAVQFPRLIL